MEASSPLSTSINPHFLAEAFCHLLTDFNISPYDPEAVSVFTQLYKLLFSSSSLSEPALGPTFFYPQISKGAKTQLSSLADHILHLLNAPGNKDVIDYTDFVKRIVVRSFGNHWDDFLHQMGITEFPEALLMLRIRLKVVAMDTAIEVLDTELASILATRTAALTSERIRTNLDH